MESSSPEFAGVVQSRELDGEKPSLSPGFAPPDLIRLGWLLIALLN
jgi:hypothetical protein